MRIVDDTNLTPREKDIVMLIIQGKNKQEIAGSLFLSVSTIKTNIEHIYQKFEVHNKVELVVYLVKNNIVEI